MYYILHSQCVYIYTYIYIYTHIYIYTPTYVVSYKIGLLNGSVQSAHHGCKETLHLRQLSVAELRSNKDEAVRERAPGGASRLP